MQAWVCRVSGSGRSQCPEEVAATFQRGARFKAAAWIQYPGEDFQMAYAVELPENKDAKAVRLEFQKQLNVRSGTVGSKLQGVKLSIEQIDRLDVPITALLGHVPGCTIIRNNQDAAAVALLPVPVQPQPAEDELNRCFTVLGLAPDAGEDEIRSHYRKLVLTCHPDKVEGQKEMFMAVQHAYQQLSVKIGRGTEDLVDAILTPKFGVLSIASSKDAIASEEAKLRAYKERLTKELSRVNARLRALFDIDGAQTELQRREEAVAFTQQFRMSAALWDPVAIACWFQVDRYNVLLTGKPGGFAKLDAKYGPHLRSGNEDLDPYMRYDNWYPKAWTYGAAKWFKVRIGLDAADAALSGHAMTLPYVALLGGNKGPHRQRLAVLGFNLRAADQLADGVPGIYPIDVATALTLPRGAPGGLGGPPQLEEEEDEEEDEEMRADVLALLQEFEEDRRALTHSPVYPQ